MEDASAIENEKWGWKKWEKHGSETSSTLVWWMLGGRQRLGASLDHVCQCQGLRNEAPIKYLFRYSMVCVCAIFCRVRDA